MSTIAAISTPHAEGGIAVIRISGTQALAIADRVFRSVSGKIPTRMTGYTCAYGSAVRGDTVLDQVVLTVFRAPHSYTGEDVAEISCHGGIYVSREILRSVLDAGAVPAEAGEFTKRAFQNGKMSLTQAEAVMDVIGADSARELRFARSLQEGAVFRRIRGIIDQIVQVLGALAAWADYPEDDIPEVSPESLSESLQAIDTQLTAAIATGDYGRILKDGVSAVIIGRPNVGKSTLFNQMSGCQRSIVTEIAGTTRDVVEERVRLGDVTLRLWDTAGLRQTQDVIEQMGVTIARERLEQADLVLAVFDGASPLGQEDLDLIGQLAQRKQRQVIAIVNKMDCETAVVPEEVAAWADCCIPMSAKDGEGLEQLRCAIEERFYRGDVTPEMGILSNERQLRCAMAAQECVQQAQRALMEGEMLDAITVLLDDAAESLMQLTGESVSEKVVEDVFSRFCVGK